MRWSDRRRVCLVAIALAITAATVPLWAQESRQGDRVIHRYFDPGQWSGDQSRQPDVDGDAGGAQRPAAQQGDAPGLWLSPGQGEWILTPDGPLGPDAVEQPHGSLDTTGGQTELDDRTDRVDELDYQTNFDPSVVPFKRGMVQNRVRRSDDGNYAAFLASDAFESVAVGGALRAGEERFWGSFLVRMDPGQRHLIPSVAPQQRVLSVETEPRIEIAIERDRADNFYLSGEHDELVRVNLELAVERRYFDGALDAAVTWEDFLPLDVAGDPELQRRSEEVLEMIGVDRGQMSPLQALENLVDYHRGFEARPFPQRGVDDLYLAVSQERVGVCRHRSITFMISARALGIHTRYVYNEAHAFVEVHWPGQGWRRIDLGGAADAFNYHSDSSGDIHDGIWDQEFPRPDSYEEEMANLAGGPGVDTGQQGEGEAEAADASERGEVDAEMAHQMAHEGFDDDGDIAEMEAADEESAEHHGMSETPPADEEPVRVELLEADGEVYRGGTARVMGRVDPVSGGETVEIFLVPSGASDLEQGLRLGTATVDSQGRFDEEWTIPQQVSLGRWQLRGRLVEGP